MAPILNLHDLGYSYPAAQHACFAGVDLTVQPGEFVAIVGGSGVGKSTLLRCIAGLIEPAHGEVHMATSPDPTRRPYGFVFQDARLLPWRRMRDNVAYGLAGLHLSRAERNARIDAAMQLTLISDLGKRWPHQLSGGQVQRAGIARALAVKPRLLLMDEPFSAVDALTRQTLQDELARICAEANLSVVFVTHDIREAVYLADRVVVLSGAPARVTANVPITLPRPRARDGREFQRVADEILDSLFDRAGVDDTGRAAATRPQADVAGVTELHRRRRA